MIIFQNLKGKPLDLENLQPDDIDINEIAHSLSMQCRYNGMIPEFYSVAQHCVIVANMIFYSTKRKDLALCGLLHDAAEAYIGDIISPVKNIISSIKMLEGIVLEPILKKEGLHIHDLYLQSIDLIHEYDVLCLDFEMKYFYENAPKLFDTYPLDQPESKYAFLNTYCFYRD